MVAAVVVLAQMRLSVGQAGTLTMATFSSRLRKLQAAQSLRSISLRTRSWAGVKKIQMK